MANFKSKLVGASSDEESPLTADAASSRNHISENEDDEEDSSSENQADKKTEGILLSSDGLLSPGTKDFD